jgi:two-component system, response regulator
VSLLNIEKLARALEISVTSFFADSGRWRDALPVRADELLDILYVEDDPRDVELTMTALKSVGIANRIFVVRDGAEALDFLFCAGQYAHRQPDDHPQMILLDLNLPRISGLEVLRRVKQDSRTRSIPVVVLSASDHDRDISVSRKLGAGAYIVKPVNLQSLSGVTPQLSLQWALLKPPALLNG